jgi:hypothetical protein
MLLANQSPNLVFASPDGVSGQPDFRSLTINDVPQKTSAVLTSNLNTSGSNVDTYITPTFEIPANSLSGGEVFRISLGTNRIIPAPSVYGEMSIHLGPNGDTADPQIWFEIGDNGNLHGDLSIEFLVTIRTNGNSAVVVTRPYCANSPGASYFSDLSAQFANANTEGPLFLGASFFTNNGGNSPTPTVWDTAVVTQVV